MNVMRSFVNAGNCSPICLHRLRGGGGGSDRGLVHRDDSSPALLCAAVLPAAPEAPRDAKLLHCMRVVDSATAMRLTGVPAAPGGKVDAPELSSGPGWEIQEVSRVGAQGVTSKSKLLAREMPRVCSRGLRADSGAAKSLKVAPAQSGSKSMRRSSPRDLYARYKR